MTTPKIGDKIYVKTCLYISHGSDDFIGGIATVSRIYNEISGGKPCKFVEVEERPGWAMNWTQHLALEQDKLREEFGDQKAHPDPDIDTPWIEEGDLVNGKKYKGPPIW